MCDKPVWRPVLPRNLRQVEYTIRKPGWFVRRLTGFKVEEEWVQVHCGEEIGFKWEPIHTIDEFHPEDYER